MFICKLPKWKYWTAYLSSLARDKRSQRFGVETRESETQTAVHAICCQLERFLPNVILKQWHTVHHINPQAGVRKSLEKCAASHILPTILSPSPYDPLLIWKILTQGCFKKTTNFYFLITWKIILIFLMQIGPSLLSWYFHPNISGEPEPAWSLSWAIQGEILPLQNLSLHWTKTLCTSRPSFNSVVTCISCSCERSGAFINCLTWRRLSTSLRISVGRMPGSRSEEGSSRLRSSSSSCSSTGAVIISKKVCAAHIFHKEWERGAFNSFTITLRTSTNLHTHKGVQATSRQGWRQLWKRLISQKKKKKKV